LLAVHPWFRSPLSAPARRFLPPWSVEETDACFIVRDANGQALAYTYFEDEPGRRSAAHLSPAMSNADCRQHCSSRAS
jgi:hypothetical protein